MAAATARIGVATVDLFPRFSLTGTVGLQSVAASDFFTGGSRFFALGPAIHWPIFNAGRIRDNIEVQDLRQEQALFAYRQAPLTPAADRALDVARSNLGRADLGFGRLDRTSRTAEDVDLPARIERRLV